MKKLKLRLDSLREEMEVLDIEELKGFKGGGEGGYYGYDTWEDFLTAVENGDVDPGVYYPDGGYGEYGEYGYHIGEYGEDPWWQWNDGQYGSYGDYGGYTEDGYWSWIDGEYTYTAIGEMLDEVVIEATGATFLLTNTTTIFSLASLGDKLTVTNYTGISNPGPSGMIGYEAVFDQNGQIGDTINLGILSVTYLHDGGIEISTNNPVGVNASVSLSVDGVGTGLSYTNSDNNIYGTDVTFRPGAATLLAVVGGFLVYVTGGAAVPILAL